MLDLWLSVLCMRSKAWHCRARVTPASSPASHCKQCSALAHHSRRIRSTRAWLRKAFSRTLRAQQLNLSDMGPKRRCLWLLLLYPRAFIFQVCNESALPVRDLGGPIRTIPRRPAELEAEIDDVNDLM